MVLAGRLTTLKLKQLNALYTAKCVKGIFSGLKGNTII